MAELSVTFSGLVLLRASEKRARVGLLKAHEGHAKKHFPLLVVREKQLTGDASARPKQLKDSEFSKHVKSCWLPPLDGDKWVGFRLECRKLSFDSNRFLPPALALTKPSRIVGCPTGNWEDLGWLVNFPDAESKIRLRKDWTDRAAVFLEVPQFGTVVCREPVDRRSNGSLDLFRFGGRDQAFTDAFVWNTKLNGPLRIELEKIEKGDCVPASVSLEPIDGAIDVYVLNQPETLGHGGTGPEHLKAFYELPFKVPGKGDLPVRIGICEKATSECAPESSRVTQEDHITVSVTISRASLSSGAVEIQIAEGPSGDRVRDGAPGAAHHLKAREGERSEEYCMAGGVWCDDEEDCDNG